MWPKWYKCIENNIFSESSRGSSTFIFDICLFFCSRSCLNLMAYLPFSHGLVAKDKYFPLKLPFFARLDPILKYLLPLCCWHISFSSACVNQYYLFVSLPNDHDNTQSTLYPSTFYNENRDIFRYLKLETNFSSCVLLTFLWLFVLMYFAQLAFCSSL